MIRIITLGPKDPSPGQRTHVEFSEDYSKTDDIGGRFGKAICKASVSKIP